jgi:L-alanine-DL-glutamate epimerase-like enolase superfamily enzyme
MTALLFPPVRLARIEAFVLRFPLARPVHTSFGAMTSRPSVLLRIEDAEGAHGWGEVWCNFPTCGAEHRARLAIEVVAPWLLAEAPMPPEAAFAWLGRRCHVLGLQAGEPGPVAQVAAGLDIALWDLAGRRTGQPLHRLLGSGRQRVPAYASGIDPRRAPGIIAASREAGFRAFKMKVGFGREADLEALQAAHGTLRAGERLMVDANQRWDRDEACAMARAMADRGLVWLEEPLAADRPWEEWRAVAAVGVPLSAGENLRGQPAFAEAVASGTLAFLQPDACKWGGISGCLPVARAAIAAGTTYCPHYLGGAVGLLAAAHLLAAAGGDGLLEVDVQENPLRSELCGPFLKLRDGEALLPPGPGLGAEPDPSVIERYRVLHAEAKAG